MKFLSPIATTIFLGCLSLLASTTRAQDPPTEVDRLLNSDPTIANGKSAIGLLLLQAPLEPEGKNHYIQKLDNYSIIQSLLINMEREKKEQARGNELSIKLNKLDEAVMKPLTKANG